MRKVKRIASPRSLSGTRLQGWGEEITGFYARPADVRAGLRPPFEHYDRLFLGEETIEALRRQFGRRCAYCERLLKEGQDQIEQFRPTMAAADLFPGGASADYYAWFAYEWRNLMLACRECASAKRNYFPVSTLRARPMTPWRETVAIERPLLIDPCRDVPTEHLWFAPNGELAPLDVKGHTTIEVLRLNRKDLVRQRKEAIEFAVTTVGRVIREASISPPAFLDVIEELAMPGAMLAVLDVVYADTMRRLGKRVVGRLREDRDIARLRGHGEAWREASEVYFHESPRPGSMVAKAPSAVRARPQYSEAVVAAIRICDFKAIDELHLQFQVDGSARGEAAGAMLLGENAAGKSTVMQALALALMEERARKDSRANNEEFAPRERHNWDVLQRSPRVEVLLSSGETRRVSIKPDGRFHDHNDGPAPMLLGYGARRFFRAHHGKSGGVARSLFDPFAVLEDPSAWLRDPANPHFDAVARAMRGIFALHGDDRVFRAEDGHVLVKAHGRVTPVERMSDGYRALFAMAVDIMRRMVEVWGTLEYAQGVVLIDEIDVHLHPRWKIEVISSLRRAMPKVQFIVTAHDALCLRGMRDGEVHVLYRDSDDRIRAREDLPNIELLRSDQLLTSDFFGLPSTASPVTETALNRYAYLLGLPQPSLEQAIERDRLGEDLRELPRGDTPAEQLIGEATERYILARRDSTARQRGELRERALEEIVRRLERRLGAETPE